MQIQLCEDDGDFHEGGVPQLVVLVVTYDDGKKKRIPYPAEKSIAALYQDLRAIAPKVAVEYCPAVETNDLEEIKVVSQSQVKSLSEGLQNANKAPSTASPEDNLVSRTAIALREKYDNSLIIEKEDIVTLVKLNPRDIHFSGTISPLVVGMDYRVLAVMGPKIPTPDGKGIKQIIHGFEVIDDNAPTPERMIVTPDEVQLKRKRILIGIEKTSVIEEMLPCPNCGILNSLALDNEKFVGVCKGFGKVIGCGQSIAIKRVISSCNACKVSVSCFDNGTKFEGHCPKCKAVIEVPNA